MMIMKTLKMIRFRNPGSSTDTQVQILKTLYNNFAEQPFNLEQMAGVIANQNLMTAYGFAGNSALDLSQTEDTSRNSTMMNSKMYAENYRFLGWLTSLTGSEAYPVVFTPLGIHVAKSRNYTQNLILESLLGYTTENEIFTKLSYPEKSRIFLCILKMINDLDGIIYKHELCMGPMSVLNDQLDESYLEKLNLIKSFRKTIKTYSEFQKVFASFASGLNMTPTSVDNCTRFPIAKLKSCKLVDDCKVRLYGKSLQCIKITENGKKILAHFLNMYDLRLSDFKKCPTSLQNALIRLGYRGMLMRSNFDLSAIKNQISSDYNDCKKFLNGKELLFSPSQTLANNVVLAALGGSATA